MLDVVVRSPCLPAMSDAAVAMARDLERVAFGAPQVPLDTQHVLHAGLYSRTIRLAPGLMITGALIKIPTLVIVQGDAMVWLGEESQRLTGYSVLPASAGRKQVFLAMGETFITMIFPSNARTVEEAEQEFTDEHDMLASRRADTPNQIIVTGE